MAMGKRVAGVERRERRLRFIPFLTDTQLHVNHPTECSVLICCVSSAPNSFALFAAVQPANTTATTATTMIHLRSKAGSVPRNKTTFCATRTCNSRGLVVSVAAVC
mmetsp:Transcript_17509/g.29715  ORF Transcript_17509/g.29715 Transcript_17509/m.29715 type:complete len:106 (+) Transcript_17509:267-584(+)